MIAFGSDHAGYALKKHLMEYLAGKKYETMDVGCGSTEPVDYPTYGEAAAREVAEGRAELAVVICGTGIGMSMTANKVGGVRAALCMNEYMARMARMHNDANALALGSRVIGEGLAESILDAFLQAKFAAGRHAARVKLLADIEKRHAREAGKWESSS
jgi:ribose 5-phosphate isomerase B